MAIKFFSIKLKNGYIENEMIGRPHFCLSLNHKEFYL